jgi:two-component system alkaline phosphatase synthesis response regulator PhoP
MSSKILIVDDEQDILEFLTYNLEKDGYEVKTASSGGEAIAICDRYIPDLIIMDIMMPEMDGISACAELKKNSELDNTLIAFLTARNEDFTQIMALNAGGDDFIQKPIRPAVFMSRIKALLRRSKKSGDTSGSELIQAGDLVIDREKIIVIKGEQKIELAKKEFELLELLATKPGKVYNREEILRKVWGREVIVGDRTIDVHVRKLREKIGKDYIKTIKGIGYKFEF